MARRTRILRALKHELDAHVPVHDKERVPAMKDVSETTVSHFLVAQIDYLKALRSFNRLASYRKRFREY